MGSWDVGLFSDDTALDVREAWVEAVRLGRAPEDVTAEVVGAFGADDPVVWLALADTQWRWGRLEASVRERVIDLIDSGRALGEWAGTEWEAQRRRVLGSLRRQLDRAAPAPKAIKERPRLDTEWEAGDVVGYRLDDGRWTLLHVIGHDPDYGGRAPVCVLLDYVGDELPEAASIERLRLRRAVLNPLPWTDETVAPLIGAGSVPSDTTASQLDATTRFPHPVFTIGAFRKGERPERRLRPTDVRTKPRMTVPHRLALGVRWCHLDGYLAAAFDLPPQPEQRPGSLLSLLGAIAGDVD
jgi:hypothetical protein